MQHSFFPRANFDMDNWLGLDPQIQRSSLLGLGPQIPRNTLSMFDPFDELDQTIGRNFQWLNQPSSLLLNQPSVPEKYRVALDCQGYNPSSIKTEINQQNQLVISADEEEKISDNDYSLKKFKKVFTLPQDALKDQMVSFMAPGGQLVVEVPLEQTEQRIDEFVPQITKSEDGKSEEVVVNMNLPKMLDPSKVNLTVKDRDLIVNYDDEQKEENKYSHISFYKRTTLPVNTDFSQLKCYNDNNKLTIKAPLTLQSISRSRHVPIQHLPVPESKPAKQVKGQQKNAK